jgi:hypothetical protein
MGYGTEQEYRLRIIELQEEVDKIKAELMLYKNTGDFNPPVTCEDHCKTVKDLCSDFIKIRVENKKLKNDVAKLQEELKGCKNERSPRTT